MFILEKHSSSPCCSLMIPVWKRRGRSDDLSIKMVSLPGLPQGRHRVHCRICFCLCFLLSFSSGQLSGKYLHVCTGKGTIRTPPSPIVHRGRCVGKHSVATGVATLLRNIWEGKEKKPHYKELLSLPASLPPRLHPLVFST